ncbi:Alpha/Beta hydrolase protein [Aspergillus floccosus]
MANIATGPEPYEGFVENSGVRIHYRAAGQGPLFVLLHGFPDNADTFKGQMAEFSKKYCVVCPTLRGFPPSDVPDDVDAYDMPHIVGDVVVIIGHFKAEKAIIGGHDFGGAAIQMLAMMAPGRIAGLILINTPILPNFYDLVNFDEEQQKMSEYTIRYIQYQPGGEKDEAEVVKFIRDPARRQEIQEYMRNSPMHGMFAYYKKNYPGPPYGQKVDTSHMRFQAATLILWGVQDEYFSSKFLDGIPRLFLAPTRLVTLPEIGHWPFQEQKEKVNREIWSWLDGLKLD